MNFTLTQKVKVLSGIGCIENIGALVSEARYKKAFLVFGYGFRETGIIDIIEKSLSESKIDYVEYEKVVPNPTCDIVDEGAKICKEEGCDCVIAVGGGSAIDTGKGINILRFNEGSILKYTTAPIAPCKGFISVPTTSGTGSELSQGAIISDNRNNMKMLIPTDSFVEEYTILDPNLTVGMPKELTMMTGLDAFSHAAEAYTSSKANPITDLICEKVMETVVEYLPVAVKGGKNIKARDKMLNAASLGGWVLYCSSDHIGHSIAHIIGAKCHIIHGAACAYGLPAVLRFIADAVPGKVKAIGKILGADYDGSESFKEIGEKAADAYISFRDDVLGLKSIKESNYYESMLGEMIECFVNDPFVDMSPKNITRDDAETMLKDSLNL